MNIQYYLHLCACGCDEKIEIKKHHKYTGIPKYINGHNSIGKNNPFHGKNHIKKSIQKMSIANIGKHFSIKTEFKKDIPSWNKGKKFNEKIRQKMAEAKKGKKRTEEARKKQSISMKGKNSLEKHWNWDGGTSFEIYPIEFKQIKKSILGRDNYTCQDPNCEHKTKKLDIHHIDYNKNNNSLENLITLCDFCHTKTNGKNKRQYFTEFYQSIMKNRISEDLL